MLNPVLPMSGLPRILSPVLQPETAGSAANPDVTVAIVHYETPELLREALRSLRASVGVSLDVVVVDNASTRFDAGDVEAAYPGATVIRNAVNTGFAAATNQALRSAKGRFALLLNPDVVVEPNSVHTMVRYLETHPDVGCVTCRVQLPDGRLDLACRRLFPTPARSIYRMTQLSRLFPRSRRFGQYNLTYLNEWQEAEIDQPCGAFMLVRSSVIEEVGLLDERYFLYCEDTDWAYRIKRAGWRIMYVPTTTVTHVKGASSRGRRSAAIRHFANGMRLFYRDYYQPIYPRAVSFVILGGITARERVLLLTERVRDVAHRGRRVARRLGLSAPS